MRRLAGYYAVTPKVMRDRALGEIARAVLKLRPDIVPKLQTVPTDDIAAIMAFLDAFFPLCDQLGWAGVNLSVIGQTLLLHPEATEPGGIWRAK